MLTKKEKRVKRHIRVRAKISGTKIRPRLCVARSANHIYAQLINDENAKVIASASDKELKNAKGDKKALAREVGKLIAKKGLENKIEKVVFDRGGIVFHGRVKALAEGAREGGLKF